MHATPALRLEPLDAVQFAPFGDVLDNDGAVRRNFFPGATAPGEGAGELRFWVSRVVPVRTMPLSIVTLERHPYAAQTFVPLAVSRWVVVVAPHLPDGLPDVTGIRAFLAAPGVGVSYRRGTWHCGTTVLDAPARFGVLMWRRAAGDDDQFHELGAAIEVDTGR